jgi:hypothetical protein
VSPRTNPTHHRANRAGCRLPAAARPQWIYSAAPCGTMGAGKCVVTGTRHGTLDSGSGESWFTSAGLRLERRRGNGRRNSTALLLSGSA